MPYGTQATHRRHADRCRADRAIQCSGLTPQQIVQKIVADAAAYSQANPGYGFQGDPLRPITGKYYGYLIRAGLY